METIIEHPVIVPYDFTSVSDVALTHAANYCKTSGKQLMVVNIVDESTQNFLRSHNQIDKFLNTKLDELCKDVSAKYSIKTSFHIRRGKVLSIRKIAEEFAISFMFIGIDQPQKRVSNVLRLIGSSPAPVYVVQTNLEWKPIKTIIFPVDEFEETRQKINCVFKLASYENITVKLFSITLSDRNFQLNQEVRVKQIEKILQKEEIAFTTEYARQNQNEFAEELLDYGQANNGDVLILMKTPRVFFQNLYISEFDKKILLNSHNIPSIYVNARDVGRYN